MADLSKKICNPQTVICLLSFALTACGGDGSVAGNPDTEAPKVAAATTVVEPAAQPSTYESVMAEAATPEAAEMAASSHDTVLAPAISGPIVNASNCSASAVQSAVNSISAGGTVNIPAGNCSWGTQQVNVPAGIYLKGAGKTATVIRRVGAVPNNNYMVAFNCTNGKRAAVSDMTFVGNGSASIQDNGLGLMKGCVDFTVFNAKFTRFTFSGLYVGAAENQHGVIYKNDFIDNYSPALRNLGYGIVVYGGGTWPALSLGSKYAVFAEDNYFSGNRHNIASNNASRYVFRHNVVVATDPVKDFAMVDSHGKSSSPRGSRSWEIYNNQFSTNISSGMERTALGIRGGDGVAFNNTMTSTIKYPVELSVEGFSCGTYPGFDQTRSAYFWNNSANGYPGGISNRCDSSLKLGRDYFTTAKPGYQPYTYPHPLRASCGS